MQQPADPKVQTDGEGRQSTNTSTFKLDIITFKLGSS
jgi:hypothetical protein